MARPTQFEIPGTEQTDVDQAMKDRLWSYLDAKDAQRRASGDTKLKLTVLFAAMTEAGIERVPYIDPSTGKRRFFVADKTPKPKTTKEPRVKRAKDERRAEKKAEKKQRDAEESVEHRKVSRASVEAEIGPLDPFASVRDAMGSTVL